MFQISIILDSKIYSLPMACHLLIKQVSVGGVPHCPWLGQCNITPGIRPVTIQKLVFMGGVIHQIALQGNNCKFVSTLNATFRGHGRELHGNWPGIKELAA